MVRNIQRDTDEGAIAEAREILATYPALTGCEVWCGKTKVTEERRHATSRRH